MLSLCTQLLLHSLNCLYPEPWDFSPPTFSLSCGKVKWTNGCQLESTHHASFAQKWLLKLSINNGLDCRSCTLISVISKSATKIQSYILNQILSSCHNTVRLRQSVRVRRSCIKDRLRVKLMKQSNNVSPGDQRKTTAEHMCVRTFVTTLISRNYTTLSDIIQLISGASQLLR